VTGQAVFEQMMAEMISPSQPSAPYIKITQEQYAEWQQVAAWDIMRGLRYGQSFCNHFGVTDNLLYYEFSWIMADDYIRKAYLDRS